MKSVGMTSTGARSRHDGFTLIELLVVIIIIGILAAVAIPAFLSQQTKAKNASENADLRSVAGKMAIYNTENPSFVGIPFGAGVGPGNSITGSNQTVGTEKVVLSKNNTVKLESVGLNGFCLSAVNLTASTPLYYDSTGGGLTSSSCTSKSYA